MPGPLDGLLNHAVGVGNVPFPITPYNPSIMERMFPDFGMGNMLDQGQMGGLRRQGLLQMGLSMLANSGQSTERRGLGQLLAGGFQQGQQGFQQALGGALQGQQMMAQIAQQKLQQERQAAFDGIAAKYKPVPGETPDQRRERMAAMISEFIAIDPAGMGGKLNAFANVFDAPKEQGPRNIDPRSKEGIAAEKELIDYRTRAEAQKARGNSIVVTDENGQQYSFNKGTGDLAPLTGADGKPLGKYDAGRIKGARENRAAIRNVDDALDLVEDNPQAFGLEKGRGLPLVGGQLDPRTDPKGVEARAAVASIGSLKIHDRSGAAVTAAEFPRLAPFIPDTKDSPGTIAKKLKRFRREYEIVMDELAEGKPLSALIKSDRPQVSPDSAAAKVRAAIKGTK
jgi:hypothetical protein